MKRLARISLALTLVAAAPLRLASQHEPLKLVYFSDFAPLSKGEGRAVGGMLIDVMNEALSARMGIRVVHEGYPWARAQEMVAAGTADGFVTVPTEARKAYAVFAEEPALRATFTMFVNRNDQDNAALLAVRKTDELGSFSVGSYIGSGWAKTSIEEKGIAVDYAPDMAAALLKLAAGRVQVFADNSLVISYNIKALGLGDRIVELPAILDDSSWSVGISRKSRFLRVVDELDATLHAMWADGSIERILARYK